MSRSSGNFKVVLSIAVALVLGCTHGGGVRAGFDFSRGTPVEFLEHLRSLGPGQFVTIAEPLTNWVRRENLEELVARLDSREPCAAVVQSYSSYLPRESTVGDEAAFLIEGFRRHRYPPELHSAVERDSRRQEILSWWQSQPRP